MGIINKVLSFVYDGSGKWILIAGIFIYLLVRMYNAEKEILSLENVVQTKNMEIAALNDSIVHLNSSVEKYSVMLTNRTMENANVNKLLEKCYAEKQTTDQYNAQIEAIMKDMETELEELDTKNEPVKIVTDAQRFKGIEFVNNQYTRIVNAD